MSTSRANQLVDAGMWLRLSGDEEGAVRLFEQALGLDPEHARARHLLMVAKAAGKATKDAPAPSLGPEPETPTNGWGDDGARVSAGAGDADALRLVGETTPVPPTVDQPRELREAVELDTLLRGAHDLMGLDDHSGALDLLKRALKIAPNRADLNRLKARSEAALLPQLESKLGPLTAIPRVVLKPDEIIWLSLDHRAGFILSQVDGELSLDDLFSLSGMSRLDTAMILFQLLAAKVVRLT